MMEESATSRAARRRPCYLAHRADGRRTHHHNRQGHQHHLVRDPRRLTVGVFRVGR